MTPRADSTSHSKLPNQDRDISNFLPGRCKDERRLSGLACLCQPLPAIGQVGTLWLGPRRSGLRGGVHDAPFSCLDGGPTEQRAGGPWQRRSRGSSWAVDERHGALNEGMLSASGWFEFKAERMASRDIVVHNKRDQGLSKWADFSLRRATLGLARRGMASRCAVAETNN